MAERLSSRFARLRVRVAHRDYWRTDTRPEEWLLIEWPDGEKEPIKYWLSTLPGNNALRQLVDIAKMRWRIERDYQELKQRLSAQRMRRCGLNATSQTRLQRCDGNWWSLSSRPYRDAHAALLQSQPRAGIETCDTVRLGVAATMSANQIRGKSFPG